MLKIQSYYRVDETCTSGSISFSGLIENNTSLNIGDAFPKIIDAIKGQTLVNPEYGLYKINQPSKNALKQMSFIRLSNIGHEAYDIAPDQKTLHRLEINQDGETYKILFYLQNEANNQFKTLNFVFDHENAIIIMQKLLNLLVNCKLLDQELVSKIETNGDFQELLILLNFAAEKINTMSSDDPNCEEFAKITRELSTIDEIFAISAYIEISKLLFNASYCECAIALINKITNFDIRCESADKLLAKFQYEYANALLCSYNIPENETTEQKYQRIESIIPKLQVCGDYGLELTSKLLQELTACGLNNSLEDNDGPINLGGCYRPNNDFLRVLRLYREQKFINQQLTAELAQLKDTPATAATSAPYQQPAIIHAYNNSQALNYNSQDADSGSSQEIDGSQGTRKKLRLQRTASN